MAGSNACWGIDLGNCALKAIRCRPGDEGGIVADAFDYIEYPKLLNQQEADATELVRDALTQFLSRNRLQGDRVAVSVPGQSGLARFVKLPPVETKKIPDIVRFEARQQIPFALEDVVWDYQKMVGGAEEGGFALETEVGLFAMKREQVFRSLKPFEDARIEVDVVQLTPLALYNYVVFDQMTDLPPADQFDPDNPPESTVILSLGTDTTDLVITNGFRVWQRSVPMGGNHFTRALSKELKLTFAKAEHLKRNARQTSQDPKAIFRAMRPVFNELLTELQRSIGYFTSIDRNAKIKNMLTLGNAMKLPGLSRFLAQNLGYDVVKPDSFKRLGGQNVVELPRFRENLLSFATAYGLALQGCGHATIGTNLMPREILFEREVVAKKPWVAAAAAALLMGLTVSYWGHWRAWRAVQDTYNSGSVTFTKAKADANALIRDSDQAKSDTDKAIQEFVALDTKGQNVIRSAKLETLWPEAYRAINACLPVDDSPRKTDEDKTAKNDEERRKQRAQEVSARREVHLFEIECVKVDELSEWYAEAKRFSADGAGAAAPAAPADPNAVPGSPPAAPPVTPVAAPAGVPGVPAAPGQPGEVVAAPKTPRGPGWIFRLRGYHFHNTADSADGLGSDAEFVRRTVIANLQKAKVTVHDKAEDKDIEIPVGDVGIGFPILMQFEKKKAYTINDPDAEDTNPQSNPNDTKKKIELERFDFEVQFSWSPPALAKPAPANPAMPDGT